MSSEVGECFLPENENHGEDSGYGFRRAPATLRCQGLCRLVRRLSWLTTRRRRKVRVFLHRRDAAGSGEHPLSQRRVRRWRVLREQVSGV